MIDIELLRSKGAIQVFQQDGYYILVDIDYFVIFLTDQNKEICDNNRNNKISLLLRDILNNRDKFKPNIILTLYDQVYNDLIFRIAILELLPDLMKTELCIAYHFENKTFHEIKITPYFDKTFERDGFVKGNAGTRFFANECLLFDNQEMRYF